MNILCGVMAGHRRAFMGAITRQRLNPGHDFVGPDAYEPTLFAIALLLKKRIAAGGGGDGLDQDPR